MNNYQLIWWGWGWRWPGFYRWTGSMARIYNWSVYAGPFEIRRRAVS